MSRQGAKDAIWERVFGPWNRCPVVPGKLLHHWNPDDAEACRVFSPTGRLFTAFEVQGQAAAAGVGFVVPEFRDQGVDLAFQGLRTWVYEDLVLEVDIRTSEQQDGAVAEGHAAALEGWWRAFAGARLPGSDTLVKPHPEREAETLDYGSEDGWHHLQVRLPFELKINTAQNQE